MFTFSLIIMPVMSFLSTSSFIYMDLFKLSAQEYSYFFALNGCFAMLAPILYLRVLRKIPRVLFLTICFASVAASGAMILIFGTLSPYAFAFLYIPVTFFGSASRPAGTMLIMNQIDTDNGTVGSLWGCIALLFGSLSMMLCSLDWPNLTMAARHRQPGLGKPVCPVMAVRLVKKNVSHTRESLIPLMHFIRQRI